MQKDEDIDTALRILKGRTGLGSVYLMQFNGFGKGNQTNKEGNKMIPENLGKHTDKIFQLFVTRFISTLHL
ncbi:hypothetical protein [Dysgonomonas mossii]|uniref:Uncharacterized protein n=1 Tax=Dysgonomonas mossii DSM 22836 TaxID=742767 RepID=F8X3W0_9BACT|nr:hypothetical protein [Dysgonomonas mossii]EGK05249.1 hypothetical protein HMPREF9456_02919 [Dysgonomonas mossii DSM 22836]